jgi:hypothetical protein
MRERTHLSALVTTAASGVALAGLAGCAGDPATPSPSASPSTPVASAAPGAPVAGCVTGNWRSTAVSAQAAGASVSGGGGVAVAIGPNGQTAIDFAGMRPVAFTAPAAGTEVSGTFTFTGTVSGTVRTGEAGAGTSASPPAGGTAMPMPTPSLTAGTSAGAVPGLSPTAGAGVGTSGTASPSPTIGGSASSSGSWEPLPPVRWGNTRVTVDLTAPVKIRMLDNAQISDYVGDGASRTGNVVDIEPLLGRGTYDCSGDTLVLTPDRGDGTRWTLTRA